MQLSPPPTLRFTRREVLFVIAGLGILSLVGQITMLHLGYSTLQDLRERRHLKKVVTVSQFLRGWQIPEGFFPGEIHQCSHDYDLCWSSEWDMPTSALRVNDLLKLEGFVGDHRFEGLGDEIPHGDEGGDAESATFPGTCRTTPTSRKKISCHGIYVRDNVMVFVFVGIRLGHKSFLPGSTLTIRVADFPAHR